MKYVITGANRGIGLELVKQLTARGNEVIATARDPGSARELLATAVRVEALDTVNPGSVAGFAARLGDEPVDVLVNNAGIGGHDGGRLADTDIEQLLDTFNVNSLGPMRVTQSLLPNLRAGAGKTVVQMSSILGCITEAGAGLFGYRASKTALNMLNKALSVELGSEGFTCVAMHPGWVQTDMGGANATLTPEESVSGMVSVIAGLDASHNGAFIDYRGQALPW
jgi:NAD(P)-dependent dehydrogenase (short-subunit alcohol dehydrogenase family)